MYVCVYVQVHKRDSNEIGEGGYEMTNEMQKAAMDNTPRGREKF